MNRSTSYNELATKAHRNIHCSNNLIGQLFGARIGLFNAHKILGIGDLTTKLQLFLKTVNFWTPFVLIPENQLGPKIWV